MSTDRIRLFACATVLAVAASAAAETEAAALAPCPDKPNCVSSLATDDDHRIEPFALAGDPAAAWTALRAAVAAMPRTKIVEERPAYLRAECTSRIFHFVDDLELAEGASGRVDVRSASRVGYGDMGVNRERVESLRKAATEAGAVQ
jgi:uncharacterized protein (DUF1499 family)